jgi:hypothetical protein
MFTFLQRFAIYIVNSAPNRKSLARGVSHFIASPVFAAPVVGLTSDSIAKDKVLDVSPARHLRCTDHRTPRVNAVGALQRITECLGGYASILRNAKAPKSSGINKVTISNPSYFDSELEAFDWGSTVKKGRWKMGA